MKLLSFSLGGVVKVGLYRDGRVLDLPAAYMEVFGVSAAPDFLYDMRKLIELGEPALKIAAEVAARAKGPSLSPGEVFWLPPVPNPEKILAVAVNYRAHGKELGHEPPKRPYFFPKFPNALVGHEGRIIKPKVARQVDWEVELVAVVGKRGKYVGREEAPGYVFGYAVGNDVSARDWQFPAVGQYGMNWIWGKSMDTAAPVGPYIVTSDELPDPHKLRVTLRVNGAVEQEGTTADLIFDVWDLLHWASQGITLKPGDLIFTGTPPGVGHAKGKYLKGGDVVEAEAEGIGVLRNYVYEEG